MKISAHILAIIVFLVLIDIGCIIVLLIGPKKESESLNQTKLMEDALFLAYSSFFNSDVVEVETLLAEKGLESILGENNQLFLYIPDSPCDACVNYQLMLIEKEYIPTGKKITLLVPSHLRKNMLAKMGDVSEKVAVRCYDSDDSFQGNHRNDEMLLFFVFEHQIDKYYVINKYYGNATSLFITTIKNKYL